MLKNIISFTASQVGEPISTTFEPNLWQLDNFRELRCVTSSVVGVYPEGIVASTPIGPSSTTGRVEILRGPRLSSENPPSEKVCISIPKNEHIYS